MATDQELDAIEEKLLAQIEGLRQQLATERKCAERAEQDALQFERRAELAEAERDQLRQQLAQAQAARQEAEAALERYAAESRRLIAEREVAKERFTRAEEEIERVNRRLEGSEAEYEEMLTLRNLERARAERAEAQTDALRAQLAALQTVRDSLIEHIAALRAQLEIWQACPVDWIWYLTVDSADVDQFAEISKWIKMVKPELFAAEMIPATLPEMQP